PDVERDEIRWTRTLHLGDRELELRGGRSPRRRHLQPVGTLLSTPIVLLRLVDEGAAGFTGARAVPRCQIPLFGNLLRIAFAEDGLREIRRVFGWVSLKLTPIRSPAVGDRVA